jgi:hypothetical protein
MPSTLPSLQARLDALQETHKATLQLINRLVSLKLEPGSLPSTTTPPDARTELTAEIHDRLKCEDEDLEIASQEVQDSASNLSASSHRDGEREKTQALLAIQVTKLREDFNQYVPSSRDTARLILPARGHDSALPKSNPNATHERPAPRNASSSSPRARLTLTRLPPPAAGHRTDPGPAATRRSRRPRT